jgi:hypothetical protein
MYNCENKLLYHEMQMVYTMNANSYLPILTCWLDVRCSQTTSETNPTMSHNTCLCASS